MKPANRPPPVRYVILFPGRTGSTFLTDHMTSHPEITANYEILSQYQESWLQQKSFLDEMIHSPRFPHIKAIGLKTKITHVLEPFKFESYLKENNFRIIHLTRSNQLKFVVSIVRAKLLRQQSGTSNLIHSDQQPVGPSIIPLADFADAKKRLRRRNRLTRIIDRIKLPTLEVVYEDMVSREQATLKKVWSFLEVRNIATTATTRKNTPEDIRSVVTNLDEILHHHPDMARFVDQV